MGPLTERLLATDSTALITAYDGPLQKPEENRTALREPSRVGIEPRTSTLPFKDLGSDDMQNGADERTRTSTPCGTGT